MGAAAAGAGNISADVSGYGHQGDLPADRYRHASVRAGSDQFFPDCGEQTGIW